MVIKESILNPTTHFNFDGLEYQKDVYLLTYGNIQLDSSGDIIKEDVTVGLRHKNDFTVVLSSNKPVTSWSDGNINFSDLDTLVGHIGGLISFSIGGGLGAGIVISQQVDQFNDLVAGNDIGDLAYVESSQGTQWLPLSMGGTYYPAGWYVWDGVQWNSDRNAIANQLEQNILNITANDGEILQLQSDVISNTVNNRVIVKQASDLSGTLDSSKIYLIDGFIDMGAISIEVPAGGLFIQGLDYFVSGLFSSTDNHTLFVTPSGGFAGNFKMSRCTLYTSGVNSKIFDLDNQGNFGSIEFQSVNIGDFSVQTTEVGGLTAYRQFRTDDCAFIRIGDGLTFSGTWAGGFRIGDSIMLSIPAGVTLFKEGTSLDFVGSSISDMNAISIDNTTTVFDFQESNFTRDEGFNLNGARFNLNSDPVPNMSLSSTKRYFRDCSGVENTYAGARWEITTQVVTPLTQGVLVKALGTTTYEDLVHYSQTADNAPIYDSTIEKDFVITGQLIVDGGANDEIDLVLRQWDDSVGAYINIRTFTRNISNIVGGLDIAYFDPYATVRMDINDRIEVWIRNNTDGTDAALVAGSFIAINVRS